MSAETILEVADLRAGYAGVAVVHGIDLRLRRGEFGVLLGANGAGKTTTLRAVLGLCDVMGGRISIAGADVTGRTPADMVARGVALVPEGRQLFSSLSVEDNLLAGAIVRGRQGRRERLNRVTDIFPILGERLRQAGGTLSGGEQQMLAIGRALMSDPEVLLVDEASLGLAPIVVRKVLELIATVNRSGVTVLAVEQNLAVLDFAHVACVLESGTVRLSGAVADIAGTLRHEVAAAYLGGRP